MIDAAAWMIYIGTAVLGVAIAYGLWRWRVFRRTATPRQLAERDRATRENYRESP